MPTPEQVSRLSGQRKTVAHSREYEEEEFLALRYAQVGLPLFPEHAAYLTVHLSSPEDFALARLRQLAAALDEGAEEDDFSWAVVVGVGFAQWRHFCDTEGLPLDPELFAGEDRLRDVLADHQPPYACDGGELFFHVKSCTRERAEQVACRILTELDGAMDLARTSCVIGDSLHEGRIYGGRMLHGLISSVEPVGMSARAIIGEEHPDHVGGCFGLTQRFVHDWQQLAGMADNELENLIGRDHRGTILANDDQRAHVRMVRVNDDDGINYRHLAQSQPFRSRCEIERRDDDDTVSYRLQPSPVRTEVGPGKEEGVFQLSYTKTMVALSATLENMLGDDAGYIKCRHLNYSHADSGGYFYVPSARELGRPAPHRSLTTAMNAFFDVRSDNGHMFYNTRDYLHHLGHRSELAQKLEPLPTDRVVELLGYCFSRWHSTWYRRRPAPEFGHLRDYLEPDERDFLQRSVAERKGMAVKKTLELVSRSDFGRQLDTYRLHPKELIVGVVPDFTLGSGFAAMRYLEGDEVSEAFLLKLGEGGAAGHNVPNYQRLLEMGVGGLIEELGQRIEDADDSEAEQFYRSAILAFEGVQIYLRNFAELARQTAESMPAGCPADRANLEAIAERLTRLAEQPPQSFLDAAQLVFSLHCCMHCSGEGLSIGRLDQLLAPFYESDSISAEAAQEVIDCFWIKMDEQVLLNHRHFNDRLTRGSGAITYEGGDFPQGAALNQWVQQVTVGGSKPNDAEEPEDACNEVTLMCLRAARRLPMNAPCLSLRVSPRTPDEVLGEAAKAMLSGGGHPFLINDDKIVAALVESGRGAVGGVDLADARDMVCDGCFESLLAGKNEFAFSYVSVPDAIEMALNRGRTYAAAGPIHINGLKASFRSPPAGEIGSFRDFYALVLEHYRFKLLDFYDGMLSRYGNLSKVCPSPLLSPLVDGCIERGRDMTAGGARYRLLAPLMNGIATAVDSLWAIRQMVFSDEAVFTLDELLTCLICDWGHDMKEPFFSATIGASRIAVQSQRFQNLRGYALGLPKLGQGHQELDRFARLFVRDLVALAHEVIRRPNAVLAEKLDAVRARYGTGKEPLDFIITPGIATFEDYAGVGSFLGASADGRRNGQTVASDFSPSPTPSDLPVSEGGLPALQRLRSWAAGPDEDGVTIDPIGLGLSNGAPVDINIREDFPEEELLDLLKAFAAGTVGSNMMSVSCADPRTLSQAERQPECYDIVRLRMGGWSELFVAMFPHHQQQHRRRPIFESAAARPK